MKNKAIYFRFMLICTLAFGLIGCATQKNSVYISDSFSGLNVFSPKIGKVSVKVDYVSQKDIADQIIQTAESIFRSQNLSNNEAAVIMNIEITQRSFLEGIEPKNSIYIDVTLVAEDGSIVGNLNRALVGKDTIVSAVMQHDQLYSICETLFKKSK